MKSIAQFIRIILLTIRTWFFRFIPEQSYLFMACGGINLVFDLAVFFVSYHFIFSEQNFKISFFTFSPHVASLLLSFLISTPTGFLLSRYVVWTNSIVRLSNQAINYLNVTLICIALNIGLLKLFVEVFHFRLFLSRLLTCVIVVITSYFLQRFYAFKVHKTTEVIN